MLPRVLALVLAAVLAAGCDSSGGSGPGQRTDPSAPVLGKRAEEPEAAADLGFPAFATKNTTRVAGADSVATAAGVARAVFSSRSRETRPAAVALVDVDDWRAAISTAQLMSRPLRAPVLFSEGDKLPAATLAALQALAPTGAKQAGGAQVLQVGKAPAVDGTKGRVLAGSDHAEQARAIDRLSTTAAGKPSTFVLVASADRPEYAMPAAGWAAKSGAPVLWVQGKTVPPATRAAIGDHGRRPRIYLVGPESVIPAAVATELAKLGRVERVSGRDPAAHSVEVARVRQAGGWNARDPGHGFVFVSAKRPADAAGAAPLSASGAYGPQLVLPDPARLDRAVESYLLDVQPGYTNDPVRGVYNHGWLMGDAAAISVDVQSRIDALLEIQPVQQEPAP